MSALSFGKSTATASCLSTSTLTTRVMDQRLIRMSSNTSVPTVSLDRLTMRRRTHAAISLTGLLRASFRNTFVPEKSTSNEFYHSFDKIEKLPPGEVAELHIGFWPAGITFKAGEGMMLKITGTPPRLAEFPGVGSPHRNKGDHEVHTGSRFQSRIVIPFV